MVAASSSSNKGALSVFSLQDQAFLSKALVTEKKNLHQAASMKKATSIKSSKAKNIPQKATATKDEDKSNTTISVFSPQDQALLARVNSVRPEKPVTVRKPQPDLTVYLPQTAHEEDAATVSVFSPQDQALLARVNSVRPVVEKPVVTKSQPDLTVYLAETQEEEDGKTVSVFSPDDQALVARVSSIRPTTASVVAEQVVPKEEQANLTMPKNDNNKADDDKSTMVDVFSPQDQALLARVNSVRPTPQKKKKQPSTTADLTVFLPSNDNGMVSVFSADDQAFLQQSTSAGPHSGTDRHPSSDTASHSVDA